MRLGNFLWAVIGTTWLGIGSTFAQDPGVYLPITLDQAIEVALNDNPTVKIADMEIERQEYVLQEAKGGLYPTVTGSGTYNYNIMNQVMFLPEGAFGPGTGGAMRMGFDHSYTGGFSLSLPLYMPTVYRNIQLTEEQIRSAVVSARATRVDLVNSVKKTYFGLLLAESSLEVLKKNIEYAEIVVRDTRNSFNQDLVSEYDLITAEVQLNNLTPTLIETENSIRVSRLMLNMLLALPLDTRLDPQEDLYDYNTYISGRRTYEVDLAGNTDLNLLDVQRNILEQQFRIQRAQRYPSLSAIAQYQVLSQSNDLKIGHYQWRGTALAGLSLNIPIFAGFVNNNREKQIRNTISQVDLQREYLVDNLDVQAQSALSDIEKAYEQMLANEQTIQQANKGYTIAKARYDIGVGTIVELNSAQVALMQADLNYSQSIYNYMVAFADLNKILGREY